MERKSEKWDNRFMDVAKLVAGWSSCVRDNRQVGCVIVKNKRILTTGYNGAPSGVENCAERGVCMREELNIPSGQQQEKCYATHAEQNALIQAARQGVSVDGATVYCTHQPCAICSKLMINAGIKRIVYGESYPDTFSVDLLKEACVALEKMKQ
jgi:dCMP deaminase